MYLTVVDTIGNAPYNVEALARDETSSGYAEVSCVYEDVVNSDSLVVKVHSRSCSGEGDLACSCDHMK